MQLSARRTVFRQATYRGCHATPVVTISKDRRIAAKAEPKAAVTIGKAPHCTLSSYCTVKWRVLAYTAESSFQHVFFSTYVCLLPHPFPATYPVSGCG